jgi:hypothetical protein
MVQPVLAALHVMMQSSAELPGHGMHVVSPVLQVVQTLLKQSAPAGHRLPHAPQLAGSFDNVTHVPLQSVVPCGQVHVVPLHTPPAGHGAHVPLQLIVPLPHPHVAPEHTPPAGHATHVPLQLLLPFAHPHVWPEHVPPVGHVTHAPPQFVSP